MWQLDWDDAFNNFVNVENPDCSYRGMERKDPHHS